MEDNPLRGSLVVLLHHIPQLAIQGLGGTLFSSPFQLPPLLPLLRSMLGGCLACSCRPFALGSYLDSVPSAQLGNWKQGAPWRSGHLTPLIASCCSLRSGCLPLLKVPAPVTQSCVYSSPLQLGDYSRPSLVGFRRGMG